MSTSQILITPTSFYSHLHNDYAHVLEIDGKKYKTPTHYIYSKMMPDKFLAYSIIQQLVPATVRKKATGILFGKKVKGGRKVAEASEMVMLQALREGYNSAFTGNISLRNKLLGTGNEGLIYSKYTHTFLEGDETVLGLNSNGNGQNKLGEILEELRSTIRKNISRPPEPVARQGDRLFFAIIRHKLLLNELRKGHFPADYTLRGLFQSLENVSNENYESVFRSKYPDNIRIEYWAIFENWLKNGRPKNNLPYPKEVLDEFFSGNDEWIIEAYDDAIKAKCVLIEHLKSLKIDYTTLVLSVAKSKVLDDYSFQKFDLDSDKVLSMTEYLEKYKISQDTLMYIGEESISDLRSTIFNRYKNGSLLIDEASVASLIEGYKGSIIQNITFPKFVPQIEQPSQQFLNLFSEDIVLEPLSPQQTFGGMPISEYYFAVHPNGACGETVQEKCSYNPSAIVAPNGGDDDDDDVDDLVQEYRANRRGNNNDGDDENDEDEDDGDDYRDYGGEEDDEDGGDGDGGDGDYGVFQNDTEFDKAVQNAKNVKEMKKVIKQYVPPVVNIRFSDEKDYPYEWLSPYYISNVYINGVYYPSVAHYVIAKLATPLQFRNTQIRTWIQKNKQPYDSQHRDIMKSPEYYHSIEYLIKILPKRLQEIYDLLYLRYSSKVFRIKFSRYPFKQILLGTGKTNIIYKDGDNQNAIAGGEIAKLLMKIRADISPEEPLTYFPSPVYDNTKNNALYTYIRERTQELLKSAILFSRYRLSPHKNYIPYSLPVVSFEDCKISLTNLYRQCNEINYNELIENPPAKYVKDFMFDLQKLLGVYFPKRAFQDISNPIVKQSINAVLVEKRDINQDNRIYVDVEEILKYIWIHIANISKFIEDGLGDNYNQNQISQKIKNIRSSLFTLEIGSRQEFVINCVLNIIKEIHSFFPDKEQMDESEINFLKDFIFPFNGTEVALNSSEEPQQFSEELTKKVTLIFNNFEQDVGIMKKLTSLVDTLINMKEDDISIYNKLTVRLKFFALNS